MVWWYTFSNIYKTGLDSSGPEGRGWVSVDAWNDAEINAEDMAMSSAEK